MLSAFYGWLGFSFLKISFTYFTYVKHCIFRVYSAAAVLLLLTFLIPLRRNVVLCDDDVTTFPSRFVHHYDARLASVFEYTGSRDEEEKVDLISDVLMRHRFF